MLKVLDNSAGPEVSLPVPAVLADFGRGFYEPDHDGQESFRWMGADSELAFAEHEGPRFLEVKIFSELDDQCQEIAVEAGETRTLLRLTHGWWSYSVLVPAGADHIRLRSNVLYPAALHPDDDRELAVRISSPWLHSDEARHRDLQVQFGRGFYDWDKDEAEVFRWTTLESELTFPSCDSISFLETRVFCEFFDLSQELIVETGGRSTEFRLVHGWKNLSIEIPVGADRAVLRCSKLFPPSFYPNDDRKLGVRVATPFVHLDDKRHRVIRQQQENAELNTEEMLAGATILASTPTSLGIDMYGVCNVKPPCVYCDWDFAKDLEKENVDAPFNLDTLAEWGEFFDNSSTLVNCSIGEPFMMKEFDELLDAFGEGGKEVEMTTNGQILTDRNIARLLDRKIELYISLDAATPETYAQLRNDAFEKILANLRKLIAAKGGRGGLPKIYLVFMPMKCNVDELEDFVRLCADLDADRLILRPLNYLEECDLDWDRAGYNFVYEDELLDFEELIRVSGRAAQLCSQLGVPLSDQLDFGGEMESLFETGFEEGRHEVRSSAGSEAGLAADSSEPIADSPVDLDPVDLDPAETVPLPVIEASVEELEELEETSLGAENLPACLEPWKSFYILRRGILPCCYGHGPIAEMDEYRETWNSPTMQAIREDLAEGRFHQFCIDSTACPIVRKSNHQENTLQEQPVAQPVGEPITSAIKHPQRLATPSGPSRPRPRSAGLENPEGDGGAKDLLKKIDRTLFFESGIKTYRSIRGLFASHD